MNRIQNIVVSFFIKKYPGIVNMPECTGDLCKMESVPKSTPSMFYATVIGFVAGITVMYLYRKK